jgi:hypothetical protein
MLKSVAVQEFLATVLPGVVKQFGSDKDAIAEAWNVYTDGLCRDGRITAKQFETWDHPDPRRIKFAIHNQQLREKNGR